MPAKLRIVFLTLFWLTVSALTIIAFAEITSPHPIKTETAKIELLQKVTGSINEAYNVTFKTNEQVNNLQAAMSLDTSNRHAIVNSLQLPGNLENIHIDEDRGLAFLANSFSGLQIIDISDPENLRIRGTVPTLGKAWGIKVLGNILYLASAKEGLHLIDISSVETPTIISKLKLEEHSILGLAVTENTVYAKTGSSGLLVIDVSNIKTPRLVKKLYSDAGAWGLLVDKNRLFVSSGRFNLEVLDISDPLNPKTANVIALPDRAWDIAIRDNIIYMPTRRAGLLIVDISRPGRPELLPPQHDLVAYDFIDLQHDQAYLATREGGFSILDLSNPIRPKLLKTFDLPDRPRDIVMSGQNAYIAAGINGLQILDSSAMVTSDQIFNLKIPGILKKVIVDENFFYLATVKNGLYITEVTSSGEPGKMLSHLPLDNLVNNMVRIDNHLYFSCKQTGLLIVDVASPSAPILVGKHGFAQNILDLVAVGNQIFLADSLKGVFVVDVKTPTNPILLSMFPLQGSRRLAIDESHLYVSTRSKLKLIDYSDPGSLVQVGSIEFPWPLQNFTNIKQLTVTGNTVYLAAGSAGLFAFDISDPNAPRLEEVINLRGDLHAVTVYQNNIFVITRQGKLWLLKRDKNKTTAHHAVIDTLGIGYDLVPYGNRIIIANGIKGLTILPLPQQLEIYNRAITSGRTDNPEKISLRIPPQANPGVYNLNLLHQGELIEFVGAVELRDAAE